MKLTAENRRTRGKTCPCATLSTTNPTWADPGSNPGLRGGRPAANRLSHGTALCKALISIKMSNGVRYFVSNLTKSLQNLSLNITNLTTFFR
jgi:hypothetical protein